MHLVERYALSSGVKIGKPKITPHFFPFLFDKYITIHNGEKVPSKNYAYWVDVINMIKPELDKKDIKIVQLGAPNEKPIDNVDVNLCGVTSFKQSFYIIKHALLHAGIDSAPQHIASAFNVPTVGIYAHTWARSCKPYWHDNVTLIESHKDGLLPSFSLSEPKQMINLIKPEEIASSILENLGLNSKIAQKTIYIGKNYPNKNIDIILDDFLKLNLQNEHVNIRLDHTLQINDLWLQDVLNKVNKANIVTDKPINTTLLKILRHKIDHLVYFATTFNKDFVHEVKSIGIPMVLSCTNKHTLNRMRVEFFDFDINLYEEESLKPKDEELQSFDPIKTRISSSKRVVVGDQIYPTLFHYKATKNQAKQSDIWLDIDFVRLYNE